MSKTKWDDLVETEQCDNCAEEFETLTNYKDKKYCEKCLALIKEKDRKLAEERKKEKEARQKEKEDQLHAISPSILNANFEHRLDDVQKDVAFLRELILKAISSPVTANPLQQNSPNPDLITQLLLNFAKNSFTDVIESIKEDADLKKFDYSVPATGHNFFFDMNNIRHEPEIMQNKDKLKIARSLNRIARGDVEMYSVVYNTVKNQLITILQQFANLKETKKNS